MASSSLRFFLKNPKMPFSSSSLPKPFSSTTREDRAWPISPRSLVRTELRVLSEKPAMFFWAAAPYWSTRLASVMSICLAKSSTILRSASVSWLSSSWMAWASLSCWAAAAAAAPVGSRVRVGASGALGASAAAAAVSRLGVRVSSGVKSV